MYYDGIIMGLEEKGYPDSEVGDLYDEFLQDNPELLVNNDENKVSFEEFEDAYNDYLGRNKD